jgi:beta-ureidopropionase / N-carbamoyl-L-amino-acid hydrolase
MNVNMDRLQKNIVELGKIGRDARGGISRPSFSKADLEARAWLKEKICAAGLCYRQDGAGNIFGRLEGSGSGRTIMAGSHIDTVINGGMFDGSLGVLAALECLERIREEGRRLAKPLEAASFTDEEGNLVGDFLGSRAFVGNADRDLLEKGMTSFGVPLGEVLKNTEFTIASILSAPKEAPDVEAYLELHIEQGPVLDEEGIPLGIVDVISGKHYRWCSFIGQAGHSGTVPLELRKDAFLGLADFALHATRHVATHHYGSLVTIGKVHVAPGAFSVVPGRADFAFEFRSKSKTDLVALEKELFALAEDIAATRGLAFVSRIMDKTTPVEIPARLKNVLAAECGALGYSFQFLPSGAGHDAQILAAKAETAMIFIPSPDGVSHAPDEAARWEDIEKGANLLLGALLRLAA